MIAVDLPYWAQSLLRVLGGTVAVLLPAGTIVYLFLFKMMSFMQSRLGPMEAGPYGSMQLFAEVGKWLRSVVEGHNRYYGVPSNQWSLASFRFHVARHWYWALWRRSQRTRLTWEQMYRLIDRWLPPPLLHHPYPLRRLGVIT